MSTAPATHSAVMPNAPERPSGSSENATERPAASPELQQKIAELQARTICYNRELMRIAREMQELRIATSMMR